MAAAMCIYTNPASAQPIDDSPAQQLQSRLRPDSITLNIQSAHAAGTKIAWAEVGTGPPLLLLNGTGSPMSEWDPLLLGKLAENRRVIVFDYPGLGASGPAPSRITFPAMADWVSEFLSAIGVGQTDMLGWSMGGFVAQELLRRHPQNVRRAILAGTNPGSHRAKLGPPWAQKIDSDPGAGLPGYYATNYPGTRCAQKAGRRTVKRVNRAINSARYPDSEIPVQTYRAMVRAENPWLRSKANLQGLASVTAPVLVMTGTQDVVTPPANSRLIARKIPGASLLLFRGAGHSFLFQQPGLIARHTLAFLTSEAPPPRRHHRVETCCSR